MKQTLYCFALVLLLNSTFCLGQTEGDLKFDIGAIDKKANPCTNFYQYACGEWMARHPIPADRAYWAVFQEMRDLNQKRVLEILERAAAARTAASEDERKIGDYYASCIDEKNLAAKDLAALAPERERIDAMKSPADLAHNIARLHELGTDALFSMVADQKLEDASQVIAYLDQSGLNLPDPSFYLSDDENKTKTRAAYRAHLEDEFKQLGESAPRAAAAAGEVLTIETSLARAELTPVERRDRKAWYHEMPLAQLRQLAPAFPWDPYFAAIGYMPTGKMNVAVPKYMQAMNELLIQTPIGDWKDYLRWELVRVSTPALPSRFREADFKFYKKTLEGVREQSSRAKQCESLTNRDLGEAVGKQYVKLYFPPSNKKRVLEMVDRIQGAMRKDFQHVSWMSPGTKQQALQKLDALRVMIGYPNQWRDYSRLVIKRGDTLGNAFRGQEFEFKRQVAKIGKPVATEEFYELPQSVEGYHDNPLNVIVFTAGILQPPFFDPRMDDAINFGLAGGVIGHELTHAFDDKGHLFDGVGNMRNWWTPQDATNYDNRAACFVRQYSNYTFVDDVKVNGKLTLGENIADNGGLQLAYAAFESEHPKQSPAIDGYTPNQRFFLGWAQWRCMNITEQKAQELALTDPHSPGKWRVNGVVSNMPGFAQAYQCRPDDVMVNKEPCRIW